MHENNDLQETVVQKLLKEIKLLEEEVETQAYINGLWVRYNQTLKQVIDSEYSDTPCRSSPGIYQGRRELGRCQRMVNRSEES